MRIFKKALADVTREICYKLYEANGSSSVYDYANKVKLEYHRCDPCDADTPTISDSKISTCALCGTYKENQTHKQFGYLSSALRYIRNYEKKHGEQNFVVNQLDEGCYEVYICPTPPNVFIR